MYQRKQAQQHNIPPNNHLKQYKSKLPKIDYEKNGQTGINDTNSEFPTKQTSQTIQEQTFQNKWRYR